MTKIDSDGFPLSVFSASLHRPTFPLRKNLFVICLAILVLLGLWVFWADHQAVARHEALFNEQQALQTSSLQLAIEDQLQMLFGKVEILVSHSILNFSEAEENVTLMCNFFSERLEAYPEILAFSYFEAPRRRACAELSRSPASIEAARVGGEWVNKYWDTLAMDAQGPLVPPFYLTEDFQIFGVLLPVRTRTGFHGVVAVMLDFTPLITQHIPSLRSGREGRGYLIDGGGTFIYHHDPAYIGRNLFDRSITFPAALSGVDRRLIDEPSGTAIYVTEENDARLPSRNLVAWQRINIDEQKVIVFLSAPDSEIFEAIYMLRLQRIWGSVFLVLVLLGGSLIFFIARQRLLVQTAEELHVQVARRTADLADSEARYRSLVENAPLGVFAFDKTGKVTGVNQTLLHILGCSPSEEEEALHFLSLQELSEMDFITLVQQYREVHGPIIVSYQYTSPWGRMAHLRLHITVLEDAAGEPHSGLALVEDLSRLRTAESTLYQRKQELAFLNRVTQLFSAPLDLGQVLRAALEEVRTLLNVFACSIWLVDPESGDLVCQQATGVEGDHVQGWRLGPGQGLAGWVASEGESLIVLDTREDPRHFEGVSQQIGQEMRSVLTVPLRVQKRIIGVLQVVDEQIARFTSEDLLLLDPLAAAISIAVENSRLFKEEQTQRVLSDALAEAAAGVNSTLDLEQVLDRILEQAERVVPGDAFNIMELDGDHVRIVRWRGYDRLGVEDLVSRFRIPLVRYHNLVSMIESGRPIIVPDVTVDPHWVTFEGWEGVRSYVGAPVKVAGQIVGFLNVDGTRHKQFSPADAQRLEAFASYAAVAIEHARLFEATRQRVYELETLQRTSLQITSTLDLSSVLDSIAHNALALVDAGDCHIYLYDETNDLFTFGAALWKDGSKEAAVKSPRRQGITASVVRTGQPIIIEDATSHPLYATSKARAWGIKSIAGFPLKRAGQVLGVFTIAFLDEPHTFTQEELRVLNLLADQSVIAVDNARLYRQLHEHAERLEERVRERTAQIEAHYAQLEAVLSSTTDGILVTDVEGQITRANTVASKWLSQGLSPEDADRLRETVCALAQRASERPGALLELTGLDLELKAAPVAMPEMHESAVVVVVHDVSHLKMLDRMKTNFVSNVSHELRTPAATIKLYVELLQRGPSDKWEYYLNALGQEAERQAKLVEDILQISRIDAGRLELNTTFAPLTALTVDAVTRHQSLAVAKGVTLQHRPPVSPITVLVDPDQIILAFNNLIRNAIQYTPSGGEIWIGVETMEREGEPWVEVSVSDTGMGIPKHELPRIFDRFFRGEKPQSLQISGTGLGLALVKEIVELHGGFVTVESEVDQGSTFSIWLHVSD